VIAALLVWAQVSVVVRAPTTVPAGEPATITVEATTKGSRPPRVVPPSFAPLSGNYVGGEERMEVRRGQMISRSIHRYVVTARAPGRYRIGPFRASLGRERATSAPRTLVVTRPPVDSTTPSIVRLARIDPNAGVNFRALVAPETVYVGAQATLQVGVFLDDEVRMRLRRNPEFVPPEPRSMLAYDVPPPPRAPNARRVGAKRYEAHVFQRALFPLAPGKWLIPPARLVYALPLTSSFFSREETHTLRTDTLEVVALEPPLEGRPADYAGAVGDLKVAATLDSGTGRVGDPVVLTLKVSGAGNVKLFPRPAIAVPWASVVKGEERVRLDPPSAYVRGSKEFDWILTPREPGTHALEAVRYPHFNPFTEKYEIAVTRPDTFTVAPGALAATVREVVDSQPLLALRTEFRGAMPPPLPQQPVFWFVALLVPLPVALFGVTRRDRRVRARRPADAVRGFARAGAAVSARELRRAYAHSLADRLSLAPSTLTHRGALGRALRRAGVTGPVARAAEALLESLDEAAYAAPVGTLPPDASRRAADILEQVDAEARDRQALLHRTRPLVMLAVLAGGAGAATLHARATPLEQFAAGVRAYGARDFPAAVAAFASVVRAEPTSADGWMNFGTAGWAGGDTAAAVVGWQRALRLEPLAADARERLGLVEAPQEGLVAGVPPLPVTPLAAAALLAWMGAWAHAALRVRARRPAFGAAASGGLALAVGLAAVTYFADYVRGAEDRAVVSEAGALRPLPALAAEEGAAVLAGDVAQTLRRQGAWTRVRLARGREGWIESERLVSLDVGAPPPRSAAP
jgi:hypothetical protein